VPKGRPNGTLAKLERELAELNARRHRVISQMKLAMDHLTLGSAASMAGTALGTAVTRGERAAGKLRRNVSPAVRARLSQLAKARWAKAKKEGKKRLG
jgi:hypothetical protein